MLKASYQASAETKFAISGFSNKESDNNMIMNSSKPIDEKIISGLTDSL
ncbi:hypothetical protein [Liquorilactobacillus aquaticus]|nr:hypothetical protein [Liquorilactobacillus aquaticus]